MTTEEQQAQVGFTVGVAGGSGVYFLNAVSYKTIKDELHFFDASGRDLCFIQQRLVGWVAPGLLKLVAPR